MKDQTVFRRISIIFFIAMLVMFVVHVQILVMFNRQELKVHGNDSSGKIRMEIDPRASNTSKWLKRDYQLTEDQRVDLTGQTIDESLYNDSGDLIREWQLRINIAGPATSSGSWWDGFSGTAFSRWTEPWRGILSGPPPCTTWGRSASIPAS